MQRYIISPVILGSGGSIQNANRAAVSDVSGVNSVSIIPTFSSGPNIGHPKYLFAFSAVCSANWSDVLAVTNSYAFPIYPLDGKMSGMATDARNAMNSDVAAFNLDGNGLHFDMTFYGDDDSYGDVINGIVQQIEPAFNLNALYAKEVAA